MNRILILVAGAALCALVLNTTLAQRPRDGDRNGPPRNGARDSDRNGPSRRGPGRGPGFGPPHHHGPPPLMKALDTNRDGQLSESEIKNAPKALRTLDRNNDGKLTREEIRPPFAQRGGPGGPPPGRGDARGPRRGPPRGESDRGRPDRERSERDRDGRGDRGGSRPNRGGPAPANPQQFVKRLMSHDKNDDGRLSKDEVPERMRRFFDRVDTNSDGQIDKSEAEAMAKRFSDRNAQRGGRGGDRPRRPADK